MITRRQFLGAGAAVPALLAHPEFALAADYDLVIRGGRVIDPAQRIDKTADVAIRGGKIAHVGSVSAKGAAEIDARGKIVTPGLIDIHTHVPDKTNTPADCLKDGVTAQLDAGSRGADNIGDMLQVAQGAPNHTRILINIARKGNSGSGELLDLTAADPAACRQAIEKNR
jgi:dihydroorotase